jgi:PAS domain S-box-containing protein
VAAANPDGKIVYINAAAERLFGWRAADVIGKDGRTLIPAPDASGEAEKIHATLVAGERHTGRLKLTRRDGTDFIGHLTASPAFDELGALVGLIAVITDHSERDQIDRERRDLELQTETLALLGVQALRQREGAGRDTAPALTEAVDATRRVLESDHVTVLDVIRGADELRIRASSPPIQQPTAILSGSRSFAGYVVLARKVVVVDDTRHEWRFEPAQTWPGFRPASAIGAPIFGPEGLRGVITAEFSAPRRFDRAASYFLQGIANIIGTVLLDDGPGRSRMF